MTVWAPGIADGASQSGGAQSDEPLLKVLPGCCINAGRIGIRSIVLTSGTPPPQGEERLTMSTSGTNPVRSIVFCPAE